MSEQLEGESFQGKVTQLLFVNPQTGYAVARLKVEEDGPGRPAARQKEVTLVGQLAELAPGMLVRVSGRYETHPSFGVQFRVERFETLAGAELGALERYLIDEVKGVGPTLARRIIERFGDETENVLTYAPERLREVRGLSATVAQRISALWRERVGLRELTVFLRTHGVPGFLAQRLYKILGHGALDIIKRDPYVLVATVSGVGFKTADLIAEKIGIARDSPERARAGLLYMLQRMAEEGHVCVPEEHLRTQLETHLGIGSALCWSALSELERRGAIVVEPSHGETWIYLRHLFQAERDLAQLMWRHRGERSPLRPDAVADAVVSAEERLGLALSPEQKKALRVALTHKTAIITGGPGTGKTTLLRALLDALDELRLKYALAAPTGRAARRLAETTGREAKTIHRLLEYSPETGSFVRGPNFPLSVDFLVLDEASMIDVELFADLLAALEAKTSLVIVGDRDQLPSVGPGQVLADLIASGLFPVVQLRQIYRQEQRSQIVAAAHRINSGLMPEFGGDASSDFFFLERNAPEEVLATVKQLVHTRLIGNFGLRDPSEIQVLSPMNRGALGVQALNTELQALLNPRGREIKAGQRHFREGDRVIQLRNNYEKQVFNGDLGRIVRFDDELGRVEVAFDDHRVLYDLTSLTEDLALGYAVTVHKSQGSQYPAVVLVLHHSHYLMLRRNLLYTAVSRAERVCVIVGSRAALLHAVRNAAESRRFTRLTERLRSLAGADKPALSS